MAKKRDQRSAASGGRRENRVQSSSERVNSASARTKLVAFFIASSIAAVVTYWFKQSSPSQFTEPYVYQQGLVTTDVNYQHILTENLKVSENTSQRHYTYPVLGYITPWNSRGYELAKREMGYDGIVLESWSRWAAYGILHDPKMRNLALQFIKQLGDALHSISSEKNSGQQLQLVYVIGPPSSEKLQEHDFGPKDLETLSEAVDGFSLMTYDFSNPRNPGPNAPLKWIQVVLELLLGTDNKNLAPKILIGINFYGNDFSLSRVKLENVDAGGGAILGRDYLALLEKHRPVLQWDKNSGEHYLFYTDDEDVRHAVFYPSLKSISLRLEEARSWGCGISIWEIGQGLEYFFDLL